MKKYTLAVMAVLALTTAANSYGWSSGLGLRDKLKGKVKRFVEDPSASVQRGTAKLQGYTQQVQQSLDAVNQLSSVVGQTAGQLLATVNLTIDQFKALPAQAQRNVLQGLQQAQQAQAQQQGF